MAVKFGNDGTVYCNTVKYKYKQARNLIADGCALGTGCYTDLSGITVRTGALYMSGSPPIYSSFVFASGWNMMQQPMTTPIAGHKYYGACWWYTSSGWTGGDTRFEWYIGDSETKKITFFSKGDTGGTWQKLSAIGSMSSVDAGSYVLRNFATSSSGTAYCTNMMIIDLTDTFGAGNEPTKDWCDNNIREWNTIVGQSSLLPTTTTTTTVLSGSSLQGLHFHNYCSLDNPAWPRDFMYNAETNSGLTEGYLIASGLKLEHAGTMTYAYYGAMETSLTSGTCPSYELYWPIADPNMGNVPQVAESNFNGGGSMHAWKRISFYGTRTNWEAGNYDCRWDFNNNNNYANVYSFSHQLVNVQGQVNTYNSFISYDKDDLSTNITQDDVNKEWCDRWVCNKGHAIIHIGDPSFNKVQFNTSYDIVCNDIEIRPERDEIKMLPNGVLVCKKLVRTQVY